MGDALIRRALARSLRRLAARIEPGPPPSPPAPERVAQPPAPAIPVTTQQDAARALCAEIDRLRAHAALNQAMRRNPSHQELPS